VIRCDKVVKDDVGNVVELRCRTVDDALKVRGVIHWVDAADSVPCTVRLYDRLFEVEAPEGLDDLNPKSLVELTGCRLEPAAAKAEPGARFQFERQGYFCIDVADSKPDALVFNRTITLRDTWAKIQKSAAPKAKTARVSTPKVSQPAATEEELSAEDQARADALVKAGVAEADARRLALAPQLGALFDQATHHTKRAAAVAKWLVNEVARFESPDLSGIRLAELVELVETDAINATAGKEVLEEMVTSGGNAKDIVAAKGLEQLGGADELSPVVDGVLAQNPEPVARFKAGEKKLMGFFVGQVMRATKGRADAKLVKDLLAKKLT
jgi:glutaminyl-tRNA synthetase